MTMTEPTDERPLTTGRVGPLRPLTAEFFAQLRREPIAVDYRGRTMVLRWRPARLDMFRSYEIEVVVAGQLAGYLEKYSDVLAGFSHHSTALTSAAVIVESVDEIVLHVFEKNN
jgi:hypothetical protein